MASTSYRNVDTFTLSGYTFNLRSRTTVGSFSRSNNTVTANNARVDVNVTGPSGGSFNQSSPIVGSYSLPSGSNRRVNTSVKGGNQTCYVGDTYSTSNQSFSFTVDKNATSVSTNNGAGRGSSKWGGGQSLSIPSAGAPTGVTRSVSSVLTTTATLGASVSSWGTNCTAGTGQRIEYKKNSAGSYTNLAYSTAASHTRAVTGLASNSRYNVRSYALNGAGHGVTSGVIDFYTLPFAPAAGTPVFDATTVTVPTTQNNGDGAYTITKQYRYQEDGGAWSDWTTYTGNDVVITDLVPSTDYNLQLRSTTTAGTTTGGVIPLTTLPAGKIIMPNGDVVNAIPRAVYPNGDVKMLQVRRVVD